MVTCDLVNERSSTIVTAKLIKIISERATGSRRYLVRRSAAARVVAPSGNTSSLEVIRSLPVCLFLINTVKK